jgi:hypothetical protein
MKSVIERLRRSKREYAQRQDLVDVHRRRDPEEDQQAGVAAGRRWAEQRASYGQLVRLVDHWRGGVPWSYTYDALSPLPCLEWPLAFREGFLAGIADIYDEVRDRL